MSDFTTSVTQFWNFLWPAALNAAAIITIAVYSSPTPGDWLRRKISSISSRRLIRFFHSQTAEALGISKLIPFVTLFLCILTLVVLKDVASFIGSEAPPVMLWTSPNSYVMNADSHSLQVIWRQLPEKSELHQITQFIEEKWAVLGKDSGYLYLSVRADRLDAIFDALKFYFFLITFLILLGLLPYLEIRLRRAAGLLLLLSVCLVLTGSYMVHTQKRLIESKVLVVRNWASLQQTIASTEVEEARAREIESRRRTDPQWWSLGLPAWTW